MVTRTPPGNALSLHALSLLTVATLFTLFFLRSLDDNRLVSWRWAFAAEDALAWALVLGIAVLIAHAAGLVGARALRPQLVLFGSGFAAAALLWSEPEVIVDAARYFTQAKQAQVYGIAYFLQAWGGEIPAWTDLPLVPLLYGAVFSLFGEERVYIQLCTSLLFAGTIVLTYRLGRTLWGDAVGLTAGALLLGMPYLLVQVPLMLVDVPTMFLFMLAVLTVTCALRRGGGRLNESPRPLGRGLRFRSLCFPSNPYSCSRQRTKWPGLTSRSSGSIWWHLSMTLSQRGLKLHPDGICCGSGGSPPRPDGALRKRMSPIAGNAAARARVYGCWGS